MEQCETEGCSGVVFKQHLCLVCANKLFDTATSSDASDLAKDDLLKNIESALEHGNESQCFISASTLCQAQNEIVDLRYQLAALPSTERVSVSREDLDLARQWFNAAVDTNPEYLTDDDFRSAERIEQALEKDNE